MLAIYEYVIPIGVFGFIVLFYLTQGLTKYISCDTVIRFLSFDFFLQVRSSWAVENHLSGGPISQTTRDFVRATMFLMQISMTACVSIVGYASLQIQEKKTPERDLLLVKLGICAIVLLGSFLLFLSATRYGLHMTFIMNTESIQNKLVTPGVLVSVVQKSQIYFALGLRLMYFFVLLLFWLISPWALLVIFPFVLCLMCEFESVSWMPSSYAYRPLNQSEDSTIEDSDEIPRPSLHGEDVLHIFG